MNKEQKERIDYVKAIGNVNETFKENTHERVKELLSIRHELNKEILTLRDKIAEKRYSERKTLLKAKHNETTLY